MVGMKGTGFAAAPAPSSASAEDEAVDTDGQDLDSASQRFQDLADRPSEDRKKDRSRSDNRRPADRDKAKGGEADADKSSSAADRRLFERQSFSKRQDERKRTIEEMQDAALSGFSSQGDRVLHGLQGLTSAGPDQASQTEPARPSVSEIMERLADRILVARPEAGQPEVRIRLNMESLSGTEVSIARAADGLSVRFAAVSAEAARLLEAGLPQLQRVLDRHELDHHRGEPVRIKVEQGQATDGSGAHGDGRSRNRRDLRDELSDLD